MKAAKSTIMIIGLITALIIAGGCSKKAETPTEHPLNKQFVKLIDTYVTSLKKGDAKTLSETVADATYAMYTPGQMEKQKAYFGEIKNWELDKSEPPYINTEANQAIYRIVLNSKLRKVTLDIDIRPNFNFGWRIYHIKPVKVERLTPESHKKYKFPSSNSTQNSNNSTNKSSTGSEKK